MCNEVMEVVVFVWINKILISYLIEVVIKYLKILSSYYKNYI